MEVSGLSVVLERAYHFIFPDTYSMYHKIVQVELGNLHSSSSITLRGSSPAFLAGKKSQNKNFDDHITTI
jgi:hypothetical protein